MGTGGGGEDNLLRLPCLLKNIAEQLLKLEGDTPNPFSFCSVMLTGELLPGSCFSSFLTKRINCLSHGCQIP